MASNTCNTCEDTIFTRLSSNPDISALIEKAIKPVIVIGDEKNIFVDEAVTEEDTTFTVRYVPYIPLVISSFTNGVPLQIQGATVTNFTLNWSYNKEVQTQFFDEASGLTAPEVVPLQTVYTLPVTGQTIQEDTTITLTADDDTEDELGTISANSKIAFGNFLYYGDVTIADTNAYDPTEEDIEALTGFLSANAKGANPITFTNAGVNQYQVIAVPNDFPVNNFKVSINPLPGGFVQVKSDLTITNSEGHPAIYTVWRSTSDNTFGTDAAGNPLTFSII